MAKRKRTVVAPEVGTAATFTDWVGPTWVVIRVTKVGESKVHGVSIHGTDEDGKFHAYPLSRLVETGRATRIGHGKWDVELPDGGVTRFKSKKAAEEFCKENTVVFTEVDL